MIKTRYLNDAEKRYGQKISYQVEAWNGIGYNFLADTMISLIALYFGASNLAIGYIASAPYIAGIVLPFIPRLLKGCNMIRMQALVWAFRSIVSIGYIALLYISKSYAVALILFIYTLFCTFRIIGIVLNDFSVKNISSATNRGSVISKIYAAYNSTSIASRFISFLVTTFNNSLVALLTLQIVGVGASLMASFKISKIPCRSVVEYTKGRNIFTILIYYMHDKVIRYILLLRWLNLIITIIMSLTIIFLRKAVGFGNNLVFLYTILQSIAIVLSAFTTKSLVDQIGSRPIIIITYIMLFALFGVFALIPVTLHFSIYLVLGFILTFIVGITNILTARFLSAFIPDKDNVNFTSMVNFVTAVLAFITGILTGVFISVGEEYNFIIGNSYLIVFSFALILILISIIVAISSRERGSMRTIDAASVIFSKSSLVAFSVIGRLDKNISSVRRRSLITSLETNNSRIATSKYKEILSSPYSEQVKDVLRSLVDLPRRDLLPQIIEIATNDEHFAQIQAINVLSSYKRDDKVREVLVKLLSSKWASTRSVAARALSFTNRSYDYLDKVNHLSLFIRHIEEEVDFIVAKSNMDKHGLYFKDLYKSSLDGKNRIYRQTRYSALAISLRPTTPDLASIYTCYKLKDIEDTKNVLIEENRDLHFIDLNFDILCESFNTNDFTNLKNIAQNYALELENNENRFMYVKQAIENVDKVENFDDIDAIATLFFLIMVIRSSDI